MTRAAFHALLLDPRTADRLTAMIEDNARVDRELVEAEARCIQEQHEAVYTQAVHRWFRQTEPR